MRKKDLVGHKYGMLVVLSEAPVYISPKGYRKRMWNCKCDCGNDCVVMGSHLTSGHSSSCGCEQLSKLKPRNVKNLVGCKFGMLTVLSQDENRIIGSNSRVVWKCICDCGNITSVLGLLLTHGRTKSCGCLSISHAERIMIDFLHKNGYDFEQQYKPNGLLGLNNGQLKFDFVIFDNLKNVKCLIELDGDQHYKVVNYFGGLTKYNQIKHNDNLKNVWCSQNGIELIRINVSDCTTDESFYNRYVRILHKFKL